MRKLASVMECLESEEATTAVSLSPVVNKEKKGPGLFARAHGVMPILMPHL